MSLAIVADTKHTINYNTAKKCQLGLILKTCAILELLFKKTLRTLFRAKYDQKTAYCVFLGVE